MAKQANMTQMPVYDNINTDGSWGMDRHTERNQPPQHTGSDSVRNRSSRAAAVCLVLLCVLLLTAVIVLCVHIHTKSTNYTEERDQLLTNITRLTEERDQLIFKNRGQPINDLQSYYGWTYYKSSFYYMPNETKNWNESRRYCTERGADLIIINNTDEQDFVKNMTGKAIVWIGLTDSEVDGTWKWVDGSTLTSNFWANGEPNGRTKENCVLTVAVPKLPEWPKLVGWLDDACTKPFQWICEKSISQLILP
ncbi:CD209 antigen-like protein A isoform X3 [Rhinichthys klamathensis goyatoka]|uniref:CD209 antigen-like protein A isoform X3 n=1 Tax=Rhinichthys klamathensis goyatoka TaxID=3034132 RepID=UPI0024B4A5FB|nr:CD209 antigen-like protein A isoform X3 [Rhinichthys klamathensis goyatoka]